jgi:hypothetical protein
LTVLSGSALVVIVGGAAVAFWVQCRAVRSESEAVLWETWVPDTASPLSVPTLADAPRSKAAEPAITSWYWKVIPPVGSSSTIWKVRALPATPKWGTPIQAATNWRLGAAPTVRVQTLPPLPGLRSSQNAAANAFGSPIEGIATLEYEVAAPLPNRR